MSPSPADPGFKIFRDPSLTVMNPATAPCEVWICFTGEIRNDGDTVVDDVRPLIDLEVDDQGSTFVTTRKAVPWPTLWRPGRR